MIIRYIFLLILLKKTYCDSSSELSHREGSDKRSHHMFLMRNKKNYHQKLPLIQSSELSI